VQKFRFVFLKTYHPKKLGNPTLGGCTLQRSYNSHVSKHLKYSCLEAYKELEGVDEAWNFVNSITWQRQVMSSYLVQNHKINRNTESVQLLIGLLAVRACIQLVQHMQLNSVLLILMAQCRYWKEMLLCHDDESQPPEIRDNQLLTSCSPCHSGFGGVIILKTENYKKNHLRLMITQEYFSSLSFS